MALSASTIFQVQSTATSGNVNGGGFNPTNANGLTDGVIASGTGNTPTLSSVSYSFTAADVTAGAWIYFPTQANITAGWYQITAQNSGVATLAAAVGQAIQVTNNRFVTNTVAGVGSGSPSGVTFLVDYSQSDAKFHQWTNLGSANGSTTLTDNSSTGAFTKVMVGNIIQLVSGTNATQAWYEVVSWTDANNVVLDRTPHGANTMSSTTGNLGGAISLGSNTVNRTDINFFAAGTAGQIATPMARYFIKGGATYTLGTGGTITTPNKSFLEGYYSVRGDRPTIASGHQPVLNIGANSITLGASSNNGWAFNITFTGTASGGVVSTASSTSFGIIKDCKVTNTGTTAGSIAISSATMVIGCEAVSYRGVAVKTCDMVNGCYIHDSDILFDGSAVRAHVENSIFCGAVTESILLGSSADNGAQLVNNTLYGAENKLGIGVNITTGATGIVALNNIIYGFTTGISEADTTTANFDDYNNYYNNTNDVSASTQWQKGANDLALNPQFANVAQITGSTATTTAGNHLVQSGATFITSGVVAGRDYVYVKSGTGVTAGIYGIASVDSETQITTDIAITANATADKVWQITTGRNFAIGTNLKAGAYPGAFPGGLTTGYLDVGAVQRQEQGGGSYTFG